jgi:ribosomal protein S27AE
MGSDTTNKLASIALLGAVFSSSTYDKIIDRGFLYCIPCGAERIVAENGDVEKCGKCGDGAYNLYKQERKI